MALVQIDNVSDGQTISTDWGNDVANTLNAVTSPATFTRTANFTLSAGGTSANLPFSTESNDQDNWWSTGSTFTCPTTGIYLIGIRVVYASGSGQAAIALDGAQVSLSAACNSTITDGGAAGLIYAVAGDTFTFDASEQTTTDSITVDAVYVTIAPVVQF